MKKIVSCRFVCRPNLVSLASCSLALVAAVSSVASVGITDHISFVSVGLHEGQGSVNQHQWSAELDRTSNKCVLGPEQCLVFKKA